MKRSTRIHCLVKQLPLFLLLGVIGFALLAGCSTGGVYHRVESGQTLYSISRAYNIDEIYLARVNGIADPTQLRVGRKLYIPGATSEKSVRVVAPSPTAQAQVAPEAPTPMPRPGPVMQNPAPSLPVTPKPPAPTVTTSQTRSSKVKLIWPLRGEILRSFSESRKEGGKGLEISTGENSPVKAAAAGKVIYSGDGVKGYGHLLILQHANDIYTVYGFNNRNLVTQGDFVSQGEKIALSGVPPGGGLPRLHFEVRRRKTAVDPILFLP